MSSPAPNPKILSRAALRQARLDLGRSGQVVVFTNGCFDLLHRGHVEYLREARSLGDALLVGVNTDASVAALKGPGRPVMGQDDRVALVAALEAVSFATLFSELSVERLVEEVAPDILVKGGDYTGAEVVGRAAVEAAGGAVRTVALWPGASTAALLERLRSPGD